jgi:S-DNA-T family DNA segregation ATPase FtsK/SpoIIIE
MAEELRWRFTEACAHRIGQTVHSVSTRAVVPHRAYAPIVHEVELTDPGGEFAPRLLVELRPGQSVADLEDNGEALAVAVGAWRLRCIPYGGLPPIVEVRLIGEDPLRATVPFLPLAPPDHVVLGVDERGQTVSTSVDDLTHLMVAGPTRGGKSGFGYSLVAQLTAASNVSLAGLDPTGLLLELLGEHPWRACGTGDDAPARYLLAVEGVVQEMDRRIAALRAMRPRTDKLMRSAEFPTVVFFVEEAAAVAKLCGHTTSKPSRVHQGLSRILAEGAKVNLFVATLVQRAEATVIGSFERDQALTRLTFRTHDAATVKMLHPDVPDDVLAAHGAALPGVFLLTAPGMGLARCRAPWVGGESSNGYGEYARLVGA